MAPSFFYIHCVQETVHQLGLLEGILPFLSVHVCPAVDFLKGCQMLPWLPHPAKTQEQRVCGARAASPRMEHTPVGSGDA